MFRNFLLTCLTCLIVTLTSTYAAATPADDFIQFSKDPKGCSFTVPDGWKFVNPNEELPAVRVHIKGKGKGLLPPNISVAVEEGINLDTNGYMKLVKNLHTSRRIGTCQELGMIETASGPAALLQIEVPSQWGECRLMQAMIVKEGRAYVMTMTALKEEFPQFYTTFFQSIESFTLNESKKLLPTGKELS